MKLKPGQQAPLFSAPDALGQTIDLNAYQGRKVMVTFYRFASCPFCNLRVQRLINQYAEFEARGLSMISFWQSPAASILEHVGQQAMPFPMIPDPDKKFYRIYGVESSWMGVLKVMRDPKLIFQSMKGGFNPTTADGEMNQIPADFLLNPDLTLHTAHYGEHIGDHVAFTEIERFLGD